MYKTYFCEETKIWSGNKRLPLYNPNISVGQVILEKLTRNPNKIITINDNNGIQLTNNELRLKIIRATLHLTKFNYKSNDIIGIISSNNHNVLPICIAAMLNGMPINPFDSHCDVETISQRLKIVKPKIIFCELNNYGNVKDAIHQVSIKNIDIVILDGGIIDDADENIRHTSIDEFFNKIDNEDDFVPPIINGLTQAAIIAYTSGTTNSSKIACISHAVALAHICKLYYSITVNSVVFTFASISWMAGIANFLTGLINGATCILTTDDFSPELMLNIIEKYKVTHIITLPTQLCDLSQYEKLPNFDISSIEMYICGGSRIYESYTERIRKYFKNQSVLFNAYGSTECGGLVAMSESSLAYTNSNGDNKNNKNGNNSNAIVGKLADGISIKIISEDGKQLGSNEIGELCLKSEYPFSGYYNNVELTKQSMDTDGWLHIDDIGYFTNDGYLCICERKLDILHYMNENISPSEIENFLLKQYAIFNVCIVGIQQKCNGEDLIAAAFLKSEQHLIDLRSINDAIREQLSESKCLRGGIYFFEKFPTTSNGKILRKAIKECIMEQYEERQPKINE